MLLDWVDESDDLRSRQCEIEQKSDIVDSEEAQPAAFLGQGLMVSRFLTNNVSLNKGPTQPYFSPSAERIEGYLCIYTGILTKAILFQQLSDYSAMLASGKKSLNINICLGLSRIQGARQTKKKKDIFGLFSYHFYTYTQVHATTRRQVILSLVTTNSHRKIGCGLSF